ncbi:MAG: MopE-related protein [Myxococcota bacterium]
MSTRTNRKLLSLVTGAVWVTACSSEEPIPSPSPDPLPVVEILSPQVGALLYPGNTPFLFSGRVSDEDADPVTLVSTWTLKKGDTIVSQAVAIPEFDGTVRLTIPFLEEADYDLTLEVVDSDGQLGSSVASFSVENQLPTALFLAPLSNASLDQGVEVLVALEISDVDQPVGLPFEVFFSLGGVELGSTLSDEQGLVSYSFVPSSEGSFDLSARVRDQFGGEALASLPLIIKPCLDQDGDGFFACPRDGLPADCNDAERLVNPGAAEVCDGLDTNCDGTKLVDEEDVDFDGQAPCEGDCNDSDAGTYSGAREVCDGRDNDCNTILPAEELDTDGDGYRGCAQGGLEPDCDDTRALVNPGLPEACDGFDTDCDGQLQSDEKDDDKDDVLICEGDCNDASFYTWPGAPERLDFQDNDCDGYPESALTARAAMGRFDGIQTDAQAGFAVGMGGDINGDGVGDLVVGAPRFSNSGTANNRGGVFLILGRTEGWRAVEASTLARGIIIHSDESNGRMGTSVSIPGDMNGDGYADVVTGIPGHMVNNATDAGGAYVLAGRKEWSNGEASTVALTLVEGSSASMALGFSLSGGGDVNGDGILDVAIGGPWTSRRPTPTGLVAVLSARSFGWSTKTSVNSITRLLGVESYAIGTSLAVAPDSGDTFDDLIIGGLGATTSPPGIIYWVPGSASLRGAVQTNVGNLNARYYQGENANERVGATVSSGADVDGDGFADHVMGRSTDGASTDAAAYVFFGGANPPISGMLEKVAPLRFLRAAGDECPCVVSALEDFNGDGLGDVAIGVAKSNRNALDSGTVYLFLGRSGRAAWPATVSLDEADGILMGEAEKDQLGLSLASGDVNKDGASDLVIGAPLATARDDRGNQYPSGGRVYVLLGTP